MTDNRYEKGKWIVDLQVMTVCTMHDDENVDRAVAERWLYSTAVPTVHPSPTQWLSVGYIAPPSPLSIPVPLSG